MPEKNKNDSKILHFENSLGLNRETISNVYITIMWPWGSEGATEKYNYSHFIDGQLNTRKVLCFINTTFTFSNGYVSEHNLTDGWMNK